MGFNTVFRFLSEIFPQIDARLLKAVAIEHSTDVDAAANAVLTEILPFWSKLAVTSSSPSEVQVASSYLSKDQSDSSASCTTSKDQRIGDLSDVDGAEPEEQSTLLRRRQLVRLRDRHTGTSSESRAITSGNAMNTDSTHTCYTGSASLSKSLDVSTDSHIYDDANDGSNWLIGKNDSEEVIVLGKTQESSKEVWSNKATVVVPNIMMDDGDRIVNPQGGCDYIESGDSNSLNEGQDNNVKVGSELKLSVMSTLLIDKNDVVNGESGCLEQGQDVNVEVGCAHNPPVMSTSLIHENGNVDENTDDASVCGNSQLENSCLDCPLVVFEKIDTPLFPPSVQEETPDASESDLVQSEIVSNTSSTDCKNPDASGSSDFLEKGATEDDLTSNTVDSRSGQLCRIDFLEEIIENARNNKKTLFAAMESVMNMMREVEIQEKAAEEAKIEASWGSLDILTKVEELKHMLTITKSANDMHRGEVYGEKAVLTTEARELQIRLLSLSEERDKSLAILDEMRESLEGRVAVAEEVRKAAEEEKMRKEESARRSLAELEAIMENVVQESKILQQEAAENSKLREFLMDRGHVVDSLQGEISVICQDARLLKEKFDERVPLSKSVSSSQTTCILASSGSSSIKSIASLAAEQAIVSETTPEDASIDVQSSKSSLEDDPTGAERKELLDDGWEFFDNESEIYSKAL
ncbi:uncharacterized protein LOC123211349 isoform X1 [Mangifera indica]|uniref:uncharacterized protein LOC123211349 isoform X1 n=1 Tax=Mangifera indica TaxID=29780 RepID=UPI001CF9CF09|nr:uncharacterized protein LOC123211349 isoform X1 [Mangifera indica]XP_044485954.1 uncharacterized protein LOC123211349 isoform X1 [Mangifera indica]XP_044485955.1 uncharacterized protein LOC123211349 isoform X1 [Mangifera indica]XP_044485956.1 uncharacterized protein LOC123211349 isoform X1 [Mangifera indica]